MFTLCDGATVCERETENALFMTGAGVSQLSPNNSTKILSHLMANTTGKTENVFFHSYADA